MISSQREKKILLRVGNEQFEWQVTSSNYLLFYASSSFLMRKHEKNIRTGKQREKIKRNFLVSSTKQLFQIMNTLAYISKVPK